MPVFSLIAAAAAATQPLPPAAEADVRCFMAMLYAVGTADKADKDKQFGLLAGASYFVGRLDVRLPGVDLSGHIARIGSDPSFFGEIDKEIARCAMASGTAMQVAGNAAQKGATSVSN